MTATVTGSGTATGRPAPAGRPAARRRFARPRASIAAARRDASAWFGVNQQAQKLDKALDYGAETRLVIGSAWGLSRRLAEYR